MTLWRCALPCCDVGICPICVVCLPLSLSLFVSIYVLSLASPLFLSLFLFLLSLSAGLVSLGYCGGYCGGHDGGLLTLLWIMRFRCVPRPRSFCILLIRSEFCFTRSNEFCSSCSLLFFRFHLFEKKRHCIRVLEGNYSGPAPCSCPL